MAKSEMEQQNQEEYLDVLTKSGLKTGVSKPRRDVHRDGDYHRAAGVFIYSESTQKLLVQRRADCKDSMPGLWDVSSAGHVSAGDSSDITVRRELREELGVTLPKDAFELIFTFLQECVMNGGKYIENQFNDVYLVTTIDPIPLEAFTLQESEVSAVKYISFEEYKNLLAKEDPEYVPYDVNGEFGQIFDIIATRYKVNMETRSLAQKQLSRYASISLGAELTRLTDGDKEAPAFLVEAGTIIDDIFHLQAWYSNPSFGDWLKKHAVISHVDTLKWMYYWINSSPWSCLDENEALLTTADSAIKLLPAASKPITGWKGLEYRTARSANFYPADMDKMEFELWWDNLDTFLSDSTTGSIDQFPPLADDLYTVPYFQEYKRFLEKVAELLQKAGDLTSSPSLKRYLHSKANAFISNEYKDSDIAWMELVSTLFFVIGL